VTGLLALSLLRAAAPADSARLARAESLLTAGALAAARAILEDELRQAPHDPDVLVLLGRTHLAWPVIGRFRAWRMFEQATRYADDPSEARYWQMHVGLRLGGADGERLARDAFFHLLETTMAYRDMWEVWERMYRGDGHRRKAVRILERYGDPAATTRRAILLIELEAYAAADSLLEDLAARGTLDVTILALRAQAALESGRFAAGERLYWRAVDQSSSDTTDVLWRQIAMIASPDEEIEYYVARGAERPDFFRGFWARREPDLTTPGNERLFEHFQRLRTARREFALLHPLASFHHSAEARALRSNLGPAILARLGEFWTGGIIPGRSRIEDQVQAAGVGVDLRDLPEPDSVTRYARFGFDGRGLVFLRFGAPLERLVSVGTGLDVEAWRYEVDGETVALAFARATADGGGDFVIYPTSRAEVYNATVMLERDESVIAPSVTMHTWVAFFRAANPELARRGFLDVIVRPGADAASVAVWDLGDQELVRTHGASPVTLTLREGVYRLGVDAWSNGRLGRLRDHLETPSLRPGWLAVSSLLVGVTPDTAPDRRAMARLMPADRVIVRDGQPLTLYAEVYDLPDQRGMARYDVTYAFEPLGQERRVTFSFPRTQVAEPAVVERLVVQPGLVPPGRYRLTLLVRDRILGLTSRAVALDIELH
jgi:hypothetical protein